MTEILCRVCGIGHLRKTKIYRLGAWAAIMGWVLIGPPLLILVMVLLGATAQLWAPESFEYLPAATLASVGVWLGVFFVPLVVGLLLTGRQVVLLCDHCGAIVMAS